jgi:hypothetical protein
MHPLLTNCFKVCSQAKSLQICYVLKPSQLRSICSMVCILDVQPFPYLIDAETDTCAFVDSRHSVVSPKPCR